MRTIARITIAFVAGIGGVALSLYLLIAGAIGEASFITLIGLFVVLAVVIAFIDRIQSFSLRDLRVEMAKIESARKEVEDRERQVRRVALALSEITVFLAAFHRRMGSEESHELEVEWLKRKVAGLLATTSAPEEERSHVFRFAREVEEMDRLKETDRKASSEKWDSIWERVRDEVKKG